jgi:translocation protein SEC63
LDQSKRRVKQNEEQEEEFLKSRGDAEDVKGAVADYAHAPRWPGERKPSWWIVLADEKSNRVVVPPLKITDIPYARLPHADADEALLEHDYRSYKIQFQGPPNVGMFTWKVYIVSDTFVGGDINRDITVSTLFSHRFSGINNVFR